MSEKRQGGVRLASDILPGKPVAVVAVTVFLFGLLLVGVAWLLLRAYRGDVGFRPPTTPPEPAPARLGGILQTPLPGDGPGRQLLREESAALERWGWVDRERELVRLPLDLAVERLLAGESPAGVPFPSIAPPPPLPDVGTDPRGSTGRVRGGHEDPPPLEGRAP